MPRQQPGHWQINFIKGIEMVTKNLRKSNSNPPKRQFETVRLGTLTAAELNGKIYKPIDPKSERVQALAKSIRAEGLLQPLHITTDNVIVSGHTRAVACYVAGLEIVQVIREPFASTVPNFAALLVAHNDQRLKSPQEQIKEAIASIDANDAHNKLLAARRTVTQQQYQRLSANGLRIIGTSSNAAKRSGISEAKMSMLKAAIGVLEKYREYWPLTLRQVHYRMLSLYILRHANKPESIYDNTQNAYKDLSDLLTRARLTGELPWESLHDPTRPFVPWRQWDSVGDYTKEQFKQFLTGYKRNLLIGQPSYVELVVEKIAAQDIAERAAGMYHVPVGVGRGYTSATSLEETAERFRASGKDHFTLLIAGDLDPEGENIVETWDKHLHYEHGIDRSALHVVKVGVNPEHVQQYNLSPLPTKESSSRQKAFVAKHGDAAYELEAFEPDVLQNIMRDSIRSVIDLNIFAEQQRRESEDARYLMALREKLRDHFDDLIIDNPD